MACGSKEAGGVYRPRHPQQTPFYKLVERFFPQFEAVYEERHQERYGFFSCRSPAGSGVSALRATRNGRWRRPVGWPSTSAPRCRMASSCSPFPSGCGSTSGSSADSWASCAAPPPAP